MQRSIHYYVLSLSEQMSRLYEGFRDKLIDIQDTNFPFEISNNVSHAASRDTQLKEFFQQTDQYFAQYYKQDPLRVVVVGEERSLAIFKALTTHQDCYLGTVKGDFTATSVYDLGKIVWPVVKEAIAGANENAMNDLETAAAKHKVVSGIEAVVQSVETETGSILYVEEDYHVNGSINKINLSQVFSKHVDILEVIDDIVDIIIEKVLKMNGTVIFLNNGSLMKLERIALILDG